MWNLVALRSLLDIKFDRNLQKGNYMTKLEAKSFKFFAAEKFLFDSIKVFTLILYLLNLIKHTIFTASSNTWKEED